MNRKFIILVITVALCFGFSACKNDEQSNLTKGLKTGEIYIYYCNSDKKSLNPVAVKLTESNIQCKALQVLEFLKKSTSNKDQLKSIPDNVQFNVDVKNGVATVSFNENYNAMNKVQEVLCRSSIVLSLTQIEDITKVKFLINGKDLVNSVGIKIGEMTNQTFVNNSGKLITAFNKINITLYYADKTGTRLKVYQTDCVLANNVSLEQYILDKLIQGPGEKDMYPTISNKVKINSVYTKDGICYVDFDNNMQTEVINVDDQILVYSIVDSLCDLPTINKVQILINGQINEKLHNNISISDTFIRNLDFVEK